MDVILTYNSSFNFLILFGWGIPLRSFEKSYVIICCHMLSDLLLIQYIHYTYSCRRFRREKQQ